MPQNLHYSTQLAIIQDLLITEDFHGADAAFERLLSYKFNIADRLGSYPAIAKRYKKRLESYPILSTMKAGLGFESNTTLPIAKWRIRHELIRAELREEITSLISSSVPPSEAGPDARIVTFGSCFAANLALELERRKVSATSLLVEESINSPEANVHLLRAIRGRPEPSITDYFDSAFLLSAKEKLASASHIIVTLGVAPHFEDREGNFIFATDYRRGIRSGELRMRTPSPAEVGTQIEDIIQQLNELSDAQLVLTISPVPLSASTEFPSAILADCVSKSTLRAALHRASLYLSFIYFPSFEIVRWLAPYSSDHFGADDGNSRHVSQWLVAEIVSAFCSRFGIPLS